MGEELCIRVTVRGEISRLDEVRLDEVRRALCSAGLTGLRLITHDTTDVTEVPHSDNTSDKHSNPDDSDNTSDNSNSQLSDNNSQRDPPSFQQACPLSLPYSYSAHSDTDLDETPPLFPHKDEDRTKRTPHFPTLHKPDPDLTSITGQQDSG